MRLMFLAAPFALAIATHSYGADISGPGRFCGYAPIIDLRSGEDITVLQSGIHAGSFRWKGAFGSLDVWGSGWAQPPAGAVAAAAIGDAPMRFKPTRMGTVYRIAIWNGLHGVAYFSSARPLTAPQVEAIKRVRLFEEGEAPSDCDLRTVFSWH